MDAVPFALPLFQPPSGMGLWIEDRQAGWSFETGEVVRFFVSNPESANDAGFVNWKPVEGVDGLPPGAWPQTDAPVMLALVDARAQGPERWAAGDGKLSPGQCRIVCVQESGLSGESFLQAVLLFDHLGVDGRWIPNLLGCAGGDSVLARWRNLIRMQEECGSWEAIAGALARFEDLILYRISVDGIIRFITPNVKRYGFVLEEIIGTPLMRFVHPEDLPVVAQSFADLDKLPRSVIRFRVLGPKGEVFHVCTASSFAAGADGQMELVGIMREETGQITASLQLERARRIGSVMHQVSGVLFGAASPEDLCSSVCRILVEEEGIPMAIVLDVENPGAAMGVWHERSCRDCRGFLSREFLEFLACYDISRPVVIAVSRHDGEFRRFLSQPELAEIRKILAIPMVYSGHRFFGKLYLFARSADAFDGQAVELAQQVAMLLTHGVLAILDRVEAARIRERLAESEEKHRHVLSSIRDVIYAFDAESRLQYISENVREIFRVTPDRILGMKFLDLANVFPFLEKNFLEGFMESFQAAVRERKPEISYRITWGEGEDRHFLEIHEQIHYHADGTLAGSTGVIRDVTEHVRVQAELERSEQKYRLLFDMSQDAVFVEDLDGRILECNEAALRMHGYSREEMMRLSVRDLISENMLDRCDGLMERLREQGGFWMEAEARRKDGTVFPTEVAARVLDLNGEKLMVSVRDVSERRRREKERLEAEKRLRQSQKMESVSLLVSRLAHDFNNLLVGILGNASLGLMETAREHPAYIPLTEIEKAAEEAAMISRQLLMYAGGWKPKLQRVALSEVLERAAREMQVAIPDSIRVMYRIESGLPAVDADPEHCAILVSHLVANGIEAVGREDGLVMVSLFFCPEIPENPLTEMIPEGVSRRGPWVCLEVADSGPGVAPQNLERIFDPFFTTKEGASGLGLTTVAGIVRHHGAVLQVACMGDHGTAFRVFFHVERDTGDVSQSFIAPIRPEPAAGGLVLLVDDDFWVRTVGSRVLAAVGRDCRVVSGGREALALAAADPWRLRLVVLDLHLPDVSGVETYARLRELRPDLPILVSSGWIGHIEPFWKPEEEAFTGVLVKPYTAQTFLQAIEELEMACSKPKEK